MLIRKKLEFEFELLLVEVSGLLYWKRENRCRVGNCGFVRKKLNYKLGRILGLELGLGIEDFLIYERGLIKWD